MKILNDLSIKWKLGVVIITSVIALMAVGLVGVYSLNQSTTAMTKMYQGNLTAVELMGNVKANALAGNLLVVQMMSEPDLQKTADLRNQLDQLGKTTNESYDKLAAPLTYQDQGVIDLFKQLEKDRDAYKQARVDVLNLASVNKNAEAYQLYVSSVEPLAKKYLKSSSVLSDTLVSRADKMQKESQRDSLATKYLMGTIFILALALLLYIGLLISSAITKPIRAMVDVCKEFAEGDFRDKPRKLVRKDEVGKLADALAEMRTNLRTLFAKVNETSEQVAASSEQLTATSEQCAVAITQVAESINGVAEGAQTQLMCVEESNALVNGLVDLINSAGEKANEAYKYADLVTSASTDGKESIDKAITQMDSILIAVNGTSEMVNKLGDSSKEIGSIVDTIKNIADQTNLLALNAAIEAARAGEHGKGFSVVADEVRKLAEQSRHETEQVAKRMTEISYHTKTALETMARGTEEVKLGVDVVGVAGKSFSRISEHVDGITEQVKEISESVDTMKNSSGKIVESVETVKQYSNKSMEESQTVSAASEEQSASMQEIASSSHSLAVLAQDLQTNISKFQI